MQFSPCTLAFVVTAPTSLDLFVNSPPFSFTLHILSEERYPCQHLHTYITQSWLNVCISYPLTEKFSLLAVRAQIWSHLTRQADPQRWVLFQDRRDTGRRNYVYTTQWIPQELKWSVRQRALLTTPTGDTGNEGYLVRSINSSYLPPGGAASKHTVHRLTRIHWHGIPVKILWADSYLPPWASPVCPFTAPSCAI